MTSSIIIIISIFLIGSSQGLEMVLVNGDEVRPDPSTATLLSLIALTLWFLFASRASLKRRLLAVLCSLAVLFGFFSSVKIISTDGDLIPRVV